MRQYIVLGHEAPTTPDFSIDARPGTAGRLDLLARCITSALLRSHGIRTDTRVYVVLANEYTLRVEGSEVQGLNPDERSTAARIRAALKQREEAIGHEEVETGPGFYLSRRDFATILETVATPGAPVVQLHEDGHPIADLAPPSDPVFVLSDHQDFTESDQAALAEHVNTRVSLGSVPIHADQAITVTHNFLDTSGFADY